MNGNYRIVLYDTMKKQLHKQRRAIKLTDRLHLLHHNNYLRCANISCKPVAAKPLNALSWERACFVASNFNFLFRRHYNLSEVTQSCFDLCRCLPASLKSYPTSTPELIFIQRGLFTFWNVSVKHSCSEFESANSLVIRMLWWQICRSVRDGLENPFCHPLHW